MSSWVALNVEPDEAVEEEVDDTKELQIEEALKLYHSALKLHSQGPEHYSQAAEAYEALLNSEIFKYPESISDFKRGAFDDAHDEIATESIAEFNVNDSTSSLFQTLYLSYKNYGKFVLDSVQDSIRTAPQTPDSEQETQRKLTEASRKALESFGDALERDDSDLNLWRQSARLSSSLNSYRLSRYCLESVLADDDNRLELRPEQLGLEEVFAEQRLRSTLQSLFDKLSASQIPAQRPKKALLKYLKQHEDPYPNLPALPADLRHLNPSKGPLAMHTSRREINPADPTWESVGKALLQALDDDDHDSLVDVPTRSIGIILPARSSQAPTTPIANAEDTEMTIDSEGHGNKGGSEVADVMLESTENDGKPEQSSPQPTKEPSEPGEEQSSIDHSAEKQLMEALESQSTQQQDKPAEQDGTHVEEFDTNSAVDIRKRSSASAANEEPEGGRMKSRRTRARESNADALAPPEEVAFDQDKYYEDRLEVFVNADDWMFSTVDSLFSKVGIDALGSIEALRGKCSGNDSIDTPQDLETRLFQDFRGLIKTWDDEKSRLMQQKDDLSPLKDIRGTSKSGLAVFLEHSRKGARKPVVEEELSSGEQLYNFSNAINSDWLHPHETSFEWLKCLLMPDFGQESSNWSTAKSTYASFLWPKDLKKTVVELLVREDEFTYQVCSELIADLEARILSSSNGAPFEYKAKDFFELEMIQTIYELHLDVFASVESLGSETDQGIRLAQRDRLARWGMLARSSIDHFVNHNPSGESQSNLTLRHLWASAFHISLAGDAQREHILLCLQDLKQILQALGNPSVSLINNTTMSELSAAVIDQEVLKLKCMDFFAKVFNSDSEDPVTLIEAIEPILEPSSIEYAEIPTENDMDHPTSHLSEMAAFLDRGDATLRLFLWRRLQEAYQAIDYPPKVVSCYLRSIEVVMAELEAAKHSEETSQHRQVTLLGWLKTLDGIVAKAILLILEESDQAFDCFDMEHLHTSMSAIARLVRLLHSFILYEDSVRVGQISGRDFRGSLAKSLENMKERMRELYVRCWILQYTLFMEAIAQNKELFDDPLEDRIHFLRSVHNALGVRSMCRYSQKRFLKLLKAEFFGLETKGDYEFDVCQLLLDLHGIKFSAFDGTVDHGCPPEKLDRPTAIMMIDFVLQQANKMNMKDLSKSELKTTIEKMQQAIGPAKASSQTPQLTFNRRLVNAYLKAPLNPSNLLRAVQGITELSTTIVPTENAKIASKGWFFLLGHAALTKFRSQKRLSPGSTSELDDAIGFFRQDLDHGTGRWETWYRLAQTYDSKLDEDITWTADKINNNRSELAALQRNAIHCYAMAVSTAMRTAEPTAETRDVMSDLYSDFGIRLYSSSREPLSMGAFSVADFPRHFSSEESQQMYKGTPFKEMSAYSTWNFASNLLKRAAVDKSKRWMTHYTLGKCLWKMFTSDDSLRTTSKKVEMQEVINAVLDAIAALPQRRDSRSDPIFEPHFKLFSFVHKLVLRGNMTPAEGSKTLLATPWARKIEPPENMEGWNPYILEVLRKYKSADKSNWHHRMGVKAAHVIYDDQQNATAAIAAKQELSQIFTKTLTIQVWRPEFERPGRHFVYTTRYVYFFVGLLDQLDDRASLDQLLRRVRKKQGDFFNHTKLWEDICLTYAKMIRRAANISEGHEESVFKPIGWEEFSTKTARLESLPHLAPESQAILELLRDALEVKKLNNNLMKITMFEDLIADLYARLYEINTPHLVEQATEENKEKMKVDHLMAGEVPPEASTPPTAAPTSDAPAPRGRTKGIARRDIQKRADTIVNTKLAPRAVASKITATGETEPPATPQGVGSTTAGPTSAPRGSTKQVSATGDGSADQRDEHDTADETELSENEDTKLGDEGTSALFPHVTDAEEGGTGDEGADEADGEDDEGGHENEGEEGDGDGDGDGDHGVTEAEGDDDEEMHDEETKLEEEDKEEKDIPTAEQSPNDTETDHVADKRDAMEITPS
ncbi:unnamed protein product [Penicillium crustosum]